MANSPSVPNALFLAARPKTLPAGICPVLIGTVLALQDGHFSPFFFFCSLLFSLFIQIGTNYANDYSDFIRGTDKVRIGPARASTSGWLPPKTVRNASGLMFCAAFLVSLPLVLQVGTWALLFVLTSIAFGILYTGGPKPLGYLGLGDILVLIYFGPVAVIGSYYVQCSAVSWYVALLSLSPGLLSCAILTANNLRDQETDRTSGKNTFVVRFGRTAGRMEYALCVLVALLIPSICGFFLPLLILPLALPLLRLVFNDRSPQEIISLLPKTALLLLLFSILFCFECLL